MPNQEITIKLPDIVNRQYQVVIGQGAWEKLPAFILDGSFKVSRLVIIADSNTDRLFGEQLKNILQPTGLRVDVIFFPAGEQNKTQEIKTKLDSQLLQLGCGRDTLVFALGGGVVGDLVGFVSATYMRGVPYVQLPTTLLSMIDSAIGGKTGVDTEYGKNLIGAFHQPVGVFMDLNTLEPLPEQQLISGAWEAIKIFLTHQAEMFDYTILNWEKVLAKDFEVIEKIVTKAVQQKIEVVSRDEKESGERQVLNFGHTIGHALELLSDYSLMHGEAVALGVLVESKISELLGILSSSDLARIASTLELTGIDIGQLKDFNSAEIITAIKRDKKSKEGLPRFVLLSQIGKVYVENGMFAHEVEEGEIKKAYSLLTDNG